MRLIRLSASLARREVFVVRGRAAAVCRLNVTSLLAALLLMAGNSVQAATQTWTNGSNDFLWNTTSPLDWSGSPWTTGNDAVFGATGVGTITVDAGGITARTLTFNNAGYTIGGGTITLNTGSINQFPTNESATINSALNKTGAGYFNAIVAAGKTLTFNGNINATAASEMFPQGNGSIIINGSIGSNYTNFRLTSGTTTVTLGAANSFTGTVEMNTGTTLNFSNVNQLGTGTGANYVGIFRPPNRMGR
jgi:hypothetical protein